MLRDHINIDVEDRLQQLQHVSLHNRGQEDITEWEIIGKTGERKGSVTLFDKLSNRRSYRVSYRVIQKDVEGKVVIDQLLDKL